MTDVKRVNYSTGQFLTATDFTREQTYHVSLRRMHNQSLHSWGVASGLEVTKLDDTHVSVSAGLAIDSRGEEIVVINPVTLDLAAQTESANLYLIATYQDVLDPVDKVQIGGVDAYVAVTERPGFTFIDPGLDPNGSPNPPAADVLALALLSLASGKVSAIDTSVRRLAGPAIGPLFTVQNLHATGSAVVSGSVRARGGSILFDGQAMAFDPSTNTSGNASIQNAHASQSLEIYGFTNQDAGNGLGPMRIIRLFDYVHVVGGMHILASTDTPSYSGYLTVDGGLEVSGQTTLHDRVIVQGPFSAGGTVLHDLFVVTDVTVTHDLHVNNNLFLDNVLIAPKKAGLVMDRFVNRLGESLEIGDVVVIGASPPTLAYGPEGMIPVPEVDLTDRVGDTRVCGVVCEVHGEITGEDGGMRRFSDAEREEGSGGFVQPGQLGHMVTLGAYAKCKVDADFAPIEAGDLLTTSPTRGHAQKVLDRAGAVGAIVGKALAPLAAGRGVIPLIVTLQ